MYDACLINRNYAIYSDSESSSYLCKISYAQLQFTVQQKIKIKDCWVSSGKSQNSFKTIFRKSLYHSFFPRKQHNAKVRFQCCHAILKMSPIRPNITICSSNFDRFSNGLGENNMRNLHHCAGIPSRMSDRMLT